MSVIVKCAPANEKVSGPAVVRPRTTAAYSASRPTRSPDRVEGDPGPGVLLLDVAGAEAELDASVAEPVERRHLAGEDGRVPEVLVGHHHRRVQPRGPGQRVGERRAATTAA